MPSPFPGMDPYLEHPDLFPGLHDRLIAYLSEALQPQLPDPYYADISRRAWVEVPHDERRETLVEIHTGHGKDRRLVTTIEVLSPSNKTPGQQGRDLYLRKQREVLESMVHLVEIDLLRAGQHTTAVPYDRLVKKIAAFDYHVCIHHFDNLEDYFVHAIQLSDRLPPISIPLLPGDGSVSIDLQAVFDRSYDAGPYRREVRYQDDKPVPPLSPERAEWAERLLRKTA